MKQILKFAYTYGDWWSRCSYGYADIKYQREAVFLTSKPRVFRVGYESRDPGSIA